MCLYNWCISKCKIYKKNKNYSLKQIKDFYLNIDESKLDILFELFEKARTSTYDLHAKILARLYGNLILNGNLNYHESTFLANISILNDEDLFKFYNLLDTFFKEQGIDIDIVVMKQEKINITSIVTQIFLYLKNYKE